MDTSTTRSVGRFGWNTRTGDWFWDEGMFELHGYPPGAVAVSTDLVLQHKDEVHRDRAATMIREVATTDHRYSHYHVIVDTEGRPRTVLTVGESRTGRSPSSPGDRWSRGFMVDVTQDENDVTRRAVQQARRGSASIQQTLGLLMGSLGLTEDAAFAVLSEVSQHHNVKVRDLARSLMEAVVVNAVQSPRDVSGLLVQQATRLAQARTPQQGSEGS